MRIHVLCLAESVLCQCSASLCRVYCVARGSAAWNVGGEPARDLCYAHAMPTGQLNKGAGPYHQPPLFEAMRQCA